MLIQNVTHPDIMEFIISKMQNANILRFIEETSNDETIKQLAKDKLKFTPLPPEERKMYEIINMQGFLPENGGFTDKAIETAKQKLKDGGTYTVHNPDFLTGANISVGITDDFMEAVEQDKDWSLRFPDTESYSEQEMKEYDEKWHTIGDVREWERLGYAVKTYRTIKARELWKLINICATYSAEPGIFFIDRANKETNAQAYGANVVATNPCGV